MDESLKEYPNIFKQIKDCKYPDITIRAKGSPWYSKYVTSSKCPYYKALCEEELQIYIKNARQFFKTTKNEENFYFSSSHDVLNVL